MKLIKGKKDRNFARFFHGQVDKCCINCLHISISSFSVCVFDKMNFITFVFLSMATTSGEGTVKPAIAQFRGLRPKLFCLIGAVQRDFIVIIRLAEIVIVRALLSIIILITIITSTAGVRQMRLLFRNSQHHYF